MPTTKITKGRSFLRAVKYDLENGTNKEDQKKINELSATDHEVIAEGFAAGKRARLLSTNLIEGDISEFAEQFHNVARTRPGIKEPVHKVSINLKPGEHLETHQWIEIADSYLKEMGYENSPFLVVEHREKDHEHIHVVTSRVDFNGKVVSDSFEQKSARIWANEIEDQYGLSITPEKAGKKGLTRIEIEQSIKKKEVPPKLLLQAILDETLENHPDTGDFVGSLEKQKISVRIREAEDKEIVGISYGYSGKAFKGSKLGAKFTWSGLKENGLIYEPERDYEILAAASRRSIKTQSERIAEQSEFSFGDGRNLGHTSGTNHDSAFGISETDRSGSYQGGRAEIAGRSGKRIEYRIEIGRNESPIESISDSAATDQPIVGPQNGSLEGGNEKELRRSWQSDRGETTTFGRTESENLTETIAAEENATAETVRSASVARSECESEYFIEEEAGRISNLYDQSSVSSIFSTIGAGNTAGTSSPPTTADLPGTGTAVVGGNNGSDIIPIPNNALGDISDIQGNVGSSEITGVANIGNAGSNNRFGSIFSGNDVYSALNFRDSHTDGGTGQSVIENPVESFTYKLEKSLDKAESITNKTLSIEEDLKAEEAEKTKIEKQHLEFEMEEVQVLSM